MNEWRTDGVIRSVVAKAPAAASQRFPSVNARPRWSSSKRTLAHSHTHTPGTRVTLRWLPLLPPPSLFRTERGVNQQYISNNNNSANLFYPFYLMIPRALLLLGL